MAGQDWVHLWVSIVLAGGRFESRVSSCKSKQRFNNDAITDAACGSTKLPLELSR